MANVILFLSYFGHLRKQCQLKKMEKEAGLEMGIKEIRQF